MRYLLFLTAISMLSMVACKSTKIQEEQEETTYLKFGNQGGFAGTTNEYYLYPSGKLVHFQSSKQSKQEINPLEKQLVAQIFENFEVMGFRDLNISDPGNLSKYIVLYEGDTQTELKWGGPNIEVPPVLNQYYINLMRIAQQNQNVIK